MTLITYIKLGGLFMKCPFCSHENTRVIDSRPADENNSIRRRRVCDECGKRFTTYEKVETIPLILLNKFTLCVGSLNMLVKSRKHEILKLGIANSK